MWEEEEQKRRERIDAGGSFDFGFERETKGSVVVGGDGWVERRNTGSDVGDRQEQTRRQNLFFPEVVKDQI